MAGKRSLSNVMRMSKVGMLVVLLALGMLMHAALFCSAASAHSMDGHTMKMGRSMTWGQMHRWGPGPGGGHYGPPFFHKDPRAFDKVRKDAFTFTSSETQQIVRLFVPAGESYIVTATGSARRIDSPGTNSSPKLLCFISKGDGMAVGALDTVTIDSAPSSDTTENHETLAVTDSVTVDGGGQYRWGEIDFDCTWQNPDRRVATPRIDPGASITAIKVDLHEEY
ncbi:hypothetical protein [Dictyobacter aurantiacus]|uniref:Uncharacterized protein n=1 Tax=Dictyobacter aurantiacus TaxID=1936993 RepID=A0A401ZL33_9CHLR|nr:hypothetical protein [Dictyobacter aurantiacus]GCE07591.1 hypothetical protein KDAU_49200 [Dictyobacter aurantiacus]